MKKIVPFNNVLTFNTDVCEITAISLEPDIVTTEDIISGSFYISGEYKITDGDIKREKFNFELPFDIALGTNYDRGTLVVDIDDFRYEVIERNKLKVNIDLYIDGEIIKEQEKSYEETREHDIKKEDISIDLGKETHQDEPEEQVVRETPNYNEEKLPEFKSKDTKAENLIESESQEKQESYEEPQEIEIKKRLDLLDEMLTNNKEEIMKEENINIVNNNENHQEETNINIFKGFDENENYVTYRVYRVLENDTLDKILEKYNITKEELAKYNNLDDIKTGDKLIIPANDK